MLAVARTALNLRPLVRIVLGKNGFDNLGFSDAFTGLRWILSFGFEIVYVKA
jgi:hypothetical protein